MSVFDQFLYPRHCCAERPRGPDGSCCRSLPALPCPPPNSLQIPGMPAHTHTHTHRPPPPPPTPPKTSPGQGRGRHQPQEQGLGAFPGLPSSPPAAHAGQVPGGERRLPAVVSSAGSPASGSHPKQEIYRLPPRSPTAAGGPLLLEGCADPQTPHIPAPKAQPQHPGCRRWGGRWPIIPTTCPRPPGPCRMAHSSSFHPHLLALIPVPAAGRTSSLSPSQNPGADPSLGRIKGKAATDFKQPASPLMPAMQMG